MDFGFFLVRDSACSWFCNMHNCVLGVFCQCVILFTRFCIFVYIYIYICIYIYIYTVCCDVFFSLSFSSFPLDTTEAPVAKFKVLHHWRTSVMLLHLSLVDSSGGVLEVPGDVVVEMTSEEAAKRLCAAVDTMRLCARQSLFAAQEARRGRLLELQTIDGVCETPDV
jgi:hypothetical protein